MVTFIHLLRNALDRAHALSRIDPLTQLLNVQSLVELGSMELRKATRQGYPMTSMFIDPDGFKAIDDTLGHQAADEGRHSQAVGRRPNGPAHGLQHLVP